jgi:hypothetical protein
MDSYGDLYPGLTKYAPDGFRSEVRSIVRELQKEAGLSSREEDRSEEPVQQRSMAAQGGFEWERP